MPADFGGIACDFIKGNTLPLSASIDTWHMPGVDGLGAQDLGKADTDISFRLIKFGSISAVETWYGQVLAKKGVVITIVDDWNVTHSRCLITRVSQPQRDTALHLGGARSEIAVEGVRV